MIFRIATLIFLSVTVIAHPTQGPSRTPKTFYFDPSQGFTLSRVTPDTSANQQAAAGSGYQVRFVPLISLIAGMFPSLLNRLGQFNNVNKATNTRRLGVADPVEENSITAPPLEDSGEEEEEEEVEDDYMEKELIECDGNHLGLWPDKSDSQRYYKCEVDPRTTPSLNCIREMMGKDTGKDLKPLERIEVPGVKPCYLLSMLKCASGFKYQHKTRICVPDIVYTTRQ